MDTTNFRIRIRKIIGENSIKNGYNKQKQADFANKIGIERSTLTHVFEEDNEPTVDLIERILSAFPKINTDWLLFDIEPMFRETVRQKSKLICETSAFGLFNQEKDQLLFEKVSEAENWEWTMEFIEDYKEQLNWKALFNNYELPWSRELIELYLDKWEWSGITCVITKMKDQTDKSNARFINFMLNNYTNKLNWSILCKEKNFDKKYLVKYDDYIDWNVISANLSLIWNRLFL
jgi:transcriptional regulator with XRE-family HTH domain